MAHERLERYLRENGLAFEVHHHPEAFTAQEVAAVEHVSGKKLAKVVMLWVDDELAMTVLPAHYMVDLDEVKGVTGAKEVRLAEEEDFADVFPDCDTGSMPPFGNLYDVPVYADGALTDLDEFFFEAGTHTDTIKMRYSDYESLVKPTIGDFGSPG